jgi:ABC-type polysaccharide/polyol phosphate transport system ATPase subunit
MPATVNAEGLGVRFQFDSQRRPVAPTMARLRRHVTEAWGIREVTLAIGPGEGVALIGPTGAGKTTLLRAIAGVMPADAGRVSVRGRIGSMLSIDSGLVETLTGRENAALLAVLSGLDRAQARGALEQIKDLSGLGDAFDRPASSYSQGMRARLGFAAVASASPKVVVLDEVHEAIDHNFRAVLERRVSELRAAGGIVIAAGHDHEILGRLCTRAVLMEAGAVGGDGPFEEVSSAYIGREETVRERSDARA